MNSAFTLSSLCLLFFSTSLFAAEIRDDFQQAEPGLLSATYLEKNWRARPYNGVKEGRVSVVKENENTFLRVSYPAGQIGSVPSGAQWMTPLAPSDEAIAEYKVRFDPEFDWTTGGKLPGLVGGTSASGGSPDPAGFSARYMWTHEGGLVVYLYHSEQRRRWGDALPLGEKILFPGKWHTIKQRVKMNTIGEPDGELQVWFDGREVLHRKNLRWRLAGHAWRIERFYFSTFHGGASDDYRPSRDNHVDFDDFVLTPSVSVPAP